MGYVVETTGRVLLPLDREDAAFPAVTEAVAQRDGWFDPDWVVLATDEEGDPKWSEQATAFYVELANWVSDGTVHLSGEDGMEWTYAYGEGRLSQSGINGWDGASEPFGEPVEDEPVAPASASWPRGWFRRR